MGSQLQLPVPRALVVTNCTTRKRASTAAASLSAGRVGEGLDEFARRWVALIRREPPVTPVGDLYCGRAFSQAKVVARALSADLYVASAGLGLVHEDDLAPNYNMSVGTGHTALHLALSRTQSTPAQWWASMNQMFGKPNPVSSLLREHSDSLFFVALPLAYVSMIQDDLAKVSDRESQRLRIFTSEAGREVVPLALTRCVLPYDERLEALPTYDGTRADFPQRALRHFIQVLGGHRLSLNDAGLAVSKMLSSLERRTVPARTKMTDNEIVALIQEKWNSRGGSSTRLLRYLRDDALVACEQGRFRDLWRQAKAARELLAAVSHGA